MCATSKGRKLSSAVSFYFLFTAVIAVENQTAEDITVSKYLSLTI